MGRQLTFDRRVALAVLIAAVPALVLAGVLGGTGSSRWVLWALAAGVEAAERLRRMGLIRAAALNLSGETRLVGADREVKLDSADVHERSLVHA